MLALYLAFRICMAGDKQYGFNRGVLMLIYFVSFIGAPVALHLANQTSSSTPTTIILDNVEVIVSDVSTPSKPIWGTILIWIFIAGMAVVAVKTAITWIRLVRVIRSGEKFEREGYILVVTDNERYAPFSWMRYVVVSRSDYNNDCSAIEAHELKHITSLHWVDLLIAQLVCIVNWFNPAAWLMRDELMLIHEYQADMAVISSGHDPQAYQMLLIKKAVGARFPSLANSLNHSKLKKRITMMYKEKTGAGRKVKALALVPMLALALGVASVPSVNAAMSTISTSGVSIGKGSETTSKPKIGSQNFKIKNFNNIGNRTTIVITGENLGNDLTVSGGTFTTMGKTYHAKAMNCDMTDGNATITIVFPFTKEYENSSLTFNVNGKDVALDIESFFNNSKALTVTGDNADSLENIKVIAYGTAKEEENPTLGNAKVIGVGAVSKDSLATDKGNMATEKSSGINDNVKIYYDGKEITEAEMKALPPDCISHIDVNKTTNEIKIFSKSS